MSKVFGFGIALAVIIFAAQVVHFLNKSLACLLRSVRLVADHTCDALVGQRAVETIGAKNDCIGRQ